MAGKSAALMLRSEQEGLARKLALIRLPRKPTKGDLRLTVPQTDTGRWGENPQVLDRTVVKELGKIAP